MIAPSEKLVVDVKTALIEAIKYADLSLGQIAEISKVLGFEIKITFPRKDQEKEP